MFTQEQVKVVNGEYYIRSIAPIWALNWTANADSKPGTVGIPYRIDQKFTDSQVLKILNAMKEIQDNSCIRYTSNKTRWQSSQIVCRFKANIGRFVDLAIFVCSFVIAIIYYVCYNCMRQCLHSHVPINGMTLSIFCNIKLKH